MLRGAVSQTPTEPPSPRTLWSEALLKLRLGVFDMPTSFMREVAKTAQGMSFADVARSTDDAIRSMALAGRDHLAMEDVDEAFARPQHREAKRRRPTRR